VLPNSGKRIQLVGVVANLRVEEVAMDSVQTIPMARRQLEISAN